MLFQEKEHYKKLLKKLLQYRVFILLIGVFFVGISQVKADEKQTTVIQPGERLVLSLTITKEELQKNPHAIQAQLAYDTNLFEEVSSEDFQYVNYWQNFTYNTKTHTFILTQNQANLSDTQVLKVALYAKKAIDLTNTVVGFTNIQLANGQKQWQVTQQVKPLVIATDTTTATQAIQQIPLTPSTKNQVKTKTGSLEQEQKASDAKIYLWLAILLFGLISLLLGYLWKKGHISLALRWFYLWLIIGLIAIILSGMKVYAVEVSGDINGDQITNEQDIRGLAEHLLAIRVIKDKRIRQQLDLDHDQVLSLNDLALLVQLADDKTNYQIQLTPQLAKHHLTKNTNFEFQFQVSLLPKMTVRAITIDGKEYSVKKINDNLYTCQLKTPNKAGIYQYTIEKVRLANNHQLSIQQKLTVDVLKSIPTVEDYLTEDNLVDGKVKLSFLIKDSEQSFLNGQLSLIDENNQVIRQKKLTTGKNSWLVDLTQNENYQLKLSIHYDLSHQHFKDADSFKEESTTLLPLALIDSYQLKFQELQLYNQDKQQQTQFNTDEELYLGFISDNLTNYPIQSVTINQKTYAVSQQNNQYFVRLGKQVTTGRKNFTVEKLQLANGKVIKLTKDNQVSALIREENVQLKNFSLNEGSDGNQLQLNVELTKGELQLKEFIYQLKNDQDQVIWQQKTSSTQLACQIDVTQQLTKTYHFTLDAKYLAKDGQVKTKRLKEVIQKANPKAIIRQITASKTGLEKQEAFFLDYIIETNQDFPIISVTTDGVTREVTQQANQHYQLIGYAGDIAGKQVITTQAITLANQTVLPVNASIALEVYKSLPTVQNYQFMPDNDKRQGKVQFDLLDADQALIDGELQVQNTHNEVIATKPITQAGHHQFSLPLAINQSYTLKVIVKAKRDQAGKLIQKDACIFENTLSFVPAKNLTLTDVQTFNTQNQVTTYFAKNEPIRLQFSSENSAHLPLQSVVVNQQTYPVTALGNNRYEVRIPSSDQAQTLELQIEKVILSNHQELSLESRVTHTVEILKSQPTAGSLTYQVDETNQLQLAFKLTDEDQALIQAQLVLYDHQRQVVYQTEVHAGTNQVQTAIDPTQMYQAVILADYCLDHQEQTTSANVVRQEQLLAQELQFQQPALEYKEITSVSLIDQRKSHYQEQVDIDLDDFKPTDYLAKVEMQQLPAFYAEIESVTVENHQLILQLKTDQAVQYEGNEKRHGLKVVFGEVKDNQAHKRFSFGELIQQMKANPQATITLSSDLDATGVTPATYAYIEQFQGTIHGNGHRIKNLTKPLFHQLQGAQIEDLIIENAQIKGKYNGILANNASQTTIKNVHMQHVSLNNAANNNVGLFFGTANTATTIVQSSVVDGRIWGNWSVGGFIGNASEVEVSNSYMDGTLHSDGAQIGGLLGYVAKNSQVINAYSHATLAVKNAGSAAGIVGKAEDSQFRLENTLSLAQGKVGYKVYGWAPRIKLTNVYELQSSQLAASDSNSSGNGKAIHLLGDDQLNSDFMQNTLHFDPQLWHLKAITLTKLPTLKNSDPGYTQATTTNQPQLADSYIPEFSRLSQLANYHVENEQAYANVYRLIPFLDANLVITYGNQLAQQGQWNQQAIRYLFAYNQANKIVHALDEQNYATLDHLRVVFADGSYVNYHLSQAKQLDHVAMYQIDELAIPYTYSKYIATSSDQLIEQIYEQASQWKYNEVYQPVTQNLESRLYQEHYDEVLKPNLLAIIKTIVQSQNEFAMVGNYPVLENHVLDRLFNDDYLKKILYTYNYFDRWYGFAIESLRLGDWLVFDSQQLSSDLTLDHLVALLTQSNMRATKMTEQFYNSALKTYTKNQSLKDFIAFLVNSVAQQAQASDWFSQQFKGMLYEAKPDERWVSYGYRAWDLLNRQQNWILPLLTIPTEDMYIITTVGHIYLGTGNLYEAYRLQPGETDKTNARNRILAKMKDYGDKYAKYYSLMLNTVEKPEVMKEKATVQYDTKGFNYQNEGEMIQIATTEEPVFKNFHYALGIDWEQLYAAAYANGWTVYWCVHYQLDDYRTSTHESVHNEDGSFLFAGHGRRAGSDAEWYTNKINTQEFSDEMTVYNFSYEFDYTEDKAVNLSTERVNTPEKLHSFYQNMFDTLYVLDYIEAQALLSLTPAEQSYLIEQYNWSTTSPTQKTNDDLGAAHNQAQPSRLTTEQLTQMNLQSMADLYDYRITMNRTTTTTMASIMLSYWYLPHYNQGIGDQWAYSFMSKEMLGYAGWVNGYVPYASGQYNQDLLALQHITGYDSFRDYKLARYEKVKNRLAQINGFDVSQVQAAFVQAFKEDAKNQRTNNQTSKQLRKIIYQNLKHVTADFTQSIYEPANKIYVNNAAELVQACQNWPTATIVLNQDIDMQAISITDTAYIDTTFAGTLEGNNHRLLNVGNTLFTALKFASIQNLMIQEPKYSDKVTASIAKRGELSYLSDVDIQAAPFNLPYFATNNATAILGETKTEVQNLTISSVADFAKINTYGLNRTYRIVNDIDFSHVSQTTPIIEGTFTGELLGEGHTIKHLSQPLFSQLNGKVHRLNIEAATVIQPTKNRLGILANVSKNAQISQIALIQPTIQGKSEVGALIGRSEANTTIQQVAVSQLNLTSTNGYAGGLVGNSMDTTITDVALQGNMAIQNGKNGGLTAALYRSTINRAYVNVAITRSNTGGDNKNGGLFGAIDYGPVSVQNCVVLGNVPANMYKITRAQEGTWDRGDIEKYLVHVYEASFSTGISNANLSQVIQALQTPAQLTADFYRQNLQFADEIWQLDDTNQANPPLFKWQLQANQSS